MYKTRMSHIIVMKKFQWEGIQLSEIFGGIMFFVGKVEASSVGGWCSVSKGGRSGALTLLFLMWWSHSDMDFLVCPHVSCTRKVIYHKVRLYYY